MKTQTIQIDKAEMDDLNSLLSGKTSSSQTSTIATYTANFGDGIEADIKVCGVDSTEDWKKEGEATPYVDAVLFDNGNEVGLLEPAFDTLDGEYLFEYNGEKYQVIVKKSVRA